MTDLKQRVDEAVRTIWELNDACAAMGSFIENKETSEYSLVKSSLIKELTEREEKLVSLLPRIEQLLIQHYHTDLEDEAHEMLMKINDWIDPSTTQEGRKVAENYVVLSENCPRCGGRLIRHNKGIECGVITCN